MSDEQAGRRKHAPVGAKGMRLSASQLSTLAKQLAKATDPVETARLKKRLTRVSSEVDRLGASAGFLAAARRP
jgi:hypothetical protein